MPDVVAAAVHVRPQGPGDLRDDRAQILGVGHGPNRVRPQAVHDQALGETTLTALRRAAEAEGAWLVVLDDDRRIEAAVLHPYADELLRSDPDAEAEVKLWTRHGHSYDDGVPADGVAGHSDERACSCWLRDFNGEAHRAGSTQMPPKPERPMVTLLCTPHDTAADAVAASRPLGRLLLEAAATGIATSPLNQALQTSTRRRLVAPASVLNVAVAAPPGHVQRERHVRVGPEGAVQPRGQLRGSSTKQHQSPRAGRTGSPGSGTPSRRHAASAAALTTVTCALDTPRTPADSPRDHGKPVLVPLSRRRRHSGEQARSESVLC